MSFDEFTWWWFLTKDGVPRISSGVRCPLSFLTCLCNYLEPKPFAIGERLVKLSDYGKSFVILLQGKLRVTRPGIRPGLPGWGPDNPDRNNLRDKEITPADREPIFGYSACLTKPQFQYVRNRTVRFCHFLPSFLSLFPSFLSLLPSCLSLLPSFLSLFPSFFPSFSLRRTGGRLNLKSTYSGTH